MDSHRSSLGRRGSRCWDIERSGSGRFIERFIGFGRVAYGRNDLAFNADGFGFCDLFAFNIDGFGLCDLFVFFQFLRHPARRLRQIRHLRPIRPLRPSLPLGTVVRVTSIMAQIAPPRQT